MRARRASCRASNGDTGFALPPPKLGPRATLQAVRAPDDIEHDLVGAGADAVEPQVAPDALDAVLLHVAGAAVDLQALVGDLDRDPRRVELRHRDLAHRVLAVREAPGRRVVELARRLELGRHLGELVPRDLELADRP